MPNAKALTCKVTSIKRLTPDVVSVHLMPPKPIRFEPGQFVSVVVPPTANNAEATKRCYSIANSPEAAAEEGIELCVKVVQGGAGSNYVSQLKVGDQVKILAPFGRFSFRKLTPGKSVCFIATGTGLAPLRSILTSKAFLDSEYKNITVVFGIRNEKDLFYSEDLLELKRRGATIAVTVTNPESNYPGHTGRVTDYLKGLPNNWNWHNTDFFICGNGAMTEDVQTLLRDVRAVSATNIHAESFSPKAKVIPFPRPAAAPASEAPQRLGWGAFLRRSKRA